MTLRALICGILALAATAAISAQAPGPDAWTLTYSVSGGIAGLSRNVTVTSGGRLQIDDRKVGRLDVPAPPGDLLVRARDVVALAREQAAPPKPPAYPDAMIMRLSVTSEGRTRDVEPTPEVVNALTRAADAAIWQALVGKWREAAWNYCTPAARLGPGDVEPAIEELSLNGDGTFSVRWPGGPHTTSLPHVAVPDYGGRFRASLTTGGIEFTLDEGVEPPRDFSGHGSFHFDGDHVLLRGIWFGTRKTAQKPDVCELSFEKQ